jgi:hypothetical protein
MVLLGAVEKFASHLSSQQGLEDGTVYTTEFLTSLLAEDLAADGMFDGKGVDQKRLNVGRVWLDGDAIRSGLMAGVVDTALHLQSRSTLGPRELCDFASSIGHHHGALFQSAPVVHPLACREPDARLSGTVHLVEPVAGARVKVSAMTEAGAHRQLLGAAVADESGHWQLDVPMLAEVLHVEASAPPMEPLFAMVRSAAGRLREIHVHPSSHLVAARSSYLIGQGVLASTAVTTVEQDFDNHFDSSLSRPQRPDVPQLLRTVGAFEKGHKAWLLHESLCRLAKEEPFGPQQGEAGEASNFSPAAVDGSGRVDPQAPSDDLAAALADDRSNAQGFSPSADEAPCGAAFSRWLSALYHDVVTDGTANGQRGDEMMEGVSLDMETLRGRLRDALSSHIEQKAGWTHAAMPTTNALWLNHLASAQGGFVDRRVAVARSQPAKFLGCWRLDESHQLEPIDGPYGTAQDVVCKWGHSPIISRAKAQSEHTDTVLSNVKFQANDSSLHFTVQPQSALQHRQDVGQIFVRLTAETGDHQSWSEELKVPFDLRQPLLYFGSHIKPGKGAGLPTAWAQENDHVVLEGTAEPFTREICASFERSREPICAALAEAKADADGRLPWTLRVNMSTEQENGKVLRLQAHSRSGVAHTEHVLVRSPLGSPSIEDQTSPYVNRPPDVSFGPLKLISRTHFDGIVPKVAEPPLAHAGHVLGQDYRIYADSFDLPALQLADARARQLPILTYSVTNQPSVGLFEGRVEFQITRADRAADGSDIITASDWQAFPFREGNQFHLPLSFQTLSKNYQEMFSGRPEANRESLVGAGQNDRWYSIEVRAVNEANETTTLRKNFKVRLFYPPIQLLDLSLSQELKNIPLGKVPDQAVLGGKAFAEGDMEWPYAVRNSFFAPKPSLALTFHLRNQMLPEKPMAAITILPTNKVKKWGRRHGNMGNSHRLQCIKVHGSGFNVYKPDVREAQTALNPRDVLAAENGRWAVGLYHGDLPSAEVWDQQDAGSSVELSPETFTHFSWRHTHTRRPFAPYRADPSHLEGSLSHPQVHSQVLIADYGDAELATNCPRGEMCYADWSRGVGRVAQEMQIFDVTVRGNDWLEPPFIIMEDVNKPSMLHHRMTWLTRDSKGRTFMQE